MSKLYKNLYFFKKFSFLLSIANVVLAFFIGATFYGSPLVIMEGDGKVLSFEGMRKDLPITQSELKKIAQDFIKLRYEWEQFNLDGMLNGLDSITTEGLQDKILSDLKKDAQSFQSISQYVGKLDLVVGPSGEVTGKFDKILRLTSKPNGDENSTEGIPVKIPLLSESQIVLKIVKGDQTTANPLGLYINSVAEYEAR